MYIDIEKVFNLAEIALPERKEDIKQIKENEYYPFICRGVLFKYEFFVCQWEVVKEVFNQPTDIMKEQCISTEITKIVEDFFNHLLPADY